MTGSAARSAVQDQLQSATLGDYEILAELGRGGMATVFLAHDIQLDRKVAIKVLHPELLEGLGTEGMVERFKQEARTAAGLSHPNIIPIYAVREQGNLLWIVMQFVPGRPLDSIMAQSGLLPVPVARTILTGVAEALAYAHRQGVVHRDVKPANIMIDREGRPVVTDFGVAKVSDRPALTQTGTSVGTPNYMSPEQCNALPTTGASDQYSLGVVGFEMLTGKPLYQGDTAVIMMFKHVYGEVPGRDAFGPATPADLVDALIRMLQKDPEARWPALEEAIPLLRGDSEVQASTVRTQLATLAAEGPQREILARVSTPRSPTPVTMHPGRPTVVAAPAVAPPPAHRKVQWWPMAIGGILAAAAALMVWRPWSSPTAAITAPDSTPTPPAVSAETADAVSPEPPPPPPPAAVPPAVEAAVVRTVRIVSPPAALNEGDSLPLQVEALDQRGNRVVRPIAWTSSDPRIALVRPSGMLVALAPGRVAINASAEGRQARVELEVLPGIATVSITPAADTLAPTASITLTATPRRRDGSEIPGAAVTWRSSDESVGVVSSTGRVTALAPGTTTISATAAGRRGTAIITVAAPAVAQAPPPPPRPVPAIPAEDNQAAINDVVASYARALEAKDMPRVRALYPGMSASSARQTQNALAEMHDLRVRIAASGITVDGTRAQARVTGQWTWQGGKPLQINNVYRFEKRGGAWVIASID